MPIYQFATNITQRCGKLSGNLIGPAKIAPSIVLDMIFAEVITNSEIRKAFREVSLSADRGPCHKSIRFEIYRLRP